MTIDESDFATLLAIVRLGDVDRRGWWRSRSCDETAEYVLGEVFPSTWLATGLELAMASAKIRHEHALSQRVGAATPVHVFSDHLPFYQLLQNWLIERKLERDLDSLAWIREATTEELLARLGDPVDGERRAEGFFLGVVQASQIESYDVQRRTMRQLSGAYHYLDEEFLAPYVDLTK